jgi:hydroxymethylpyrimidine/phosphomethylpyrimidine kinase
MACFRMINVLTIAGSDSCGGAGIQADIKTIHSLGAHALTAVTVVTAQNSLGVSATYSVPATFIIRQVETVLSDAPPRAVKIGMLGKAAAIRAVTSIVKGYKLENVVLDPVIRATTGNRLLDNKAVSVLRDLLIPNVRVITPNLEEAGVLLGRTVRSLSDAEEAAWILHEMGPEVVVTGGHLPGECVDIVCSGRGLHKFRGERLDNPHNHGTGCVFSSALATCLGFGDDILKAAERAGRFTRNAIKNGYPCGKGAGVVNPYKGGTSNIER